MQKREQQGNWQGCPGRPERSPSAIPIPLACLQVSLQVIIPRTFTLHLTLQAGLDTFSCPPRTIDEAGTSSINGDSVTRVSRQACGMQSQIIACLFNFLKSHHVYYLIASSQQAQRSRQTHTHTLSFTVQVRQGGGGGRFPPGPSLQGEGCACPDLLTISHASHSTDELTSRSLMRVIVSNTTFYVSKST